MPAHTAKTKGRQGSQSSLPLFFLIFCLVFQAFIREMRPPIQGSFVLCALSFREGPYSSRHLLFFQRGLHRFKAAASGSSVRPFSSPPAPLAKSSLKKALGRFLCLLKALRYDRIFPLTDMVTTCTGICLPLACSALVTAFSIPPQQGTSIRTTVTLRMSFSLKMAVSFSA